MTIKLEVIKKNNNNTETINITQLVKNVNWSGDYQLAGRELEFSLLNSSYDKNLPKIDIPLFSVIKFYENNEELFRGFVIFRNKSSDSNEISYQCIDKGVYLANNEGVYNFKGKTPKFIATKICGDFGISIGSLANPLYKFDKKFMGSNLYDIIMTAYSLAAAKNSKKYMTTFKKDKLYVIEKGIKVLEIKFENGKNIISSSFSEDGSDIKSKVVVINDDGKVVYTKVDNDLMKLAGSFQKVIKQEEGKSYKEQATEAIKGIEKKASIKGFGDTTCITGYGVHVKDSSTGLTGLFYIDQDKHTWENGVYSIELTLNFKNIMNEVDASENESTTTTSSSSSTSNSKAQKVVAMAKSKLGCKYVWGAQGPNTFDCSGLMWYCFKNAANKNLPRTSKEQSKVGTKISKSNLQAGDMVFFNTSGSGVSHVGLYIGNGNMIHAPKPGDVVKTVSINSNYYTKKFVTARRVL